MATKCNCRRSTECILIHATLLLAVHTNSLCLSSSLYLSHLLSFSAPLSLPLVFLSVLLYFINSACIILQGIQSVALLTLLSFARAEREVLHTAYAGEQAKGHEAGSGGAGRNGSLNFRLTLPSYADEAIRFKCRHSHRR